MGKEFSVSAKSYPFDEGNPFENVVHVEQIEDDYSDEENVGDYTNGGYHPCHVGYYFMDDIGYN